ncbi:MAG: hypothetical protein R3E68_06820 [Burkholderiaceae bacterium]
MSDLPALSADLTQAIAALSAPTPDPDLVLDQAKSIERRLAGLLSRPPLPGTAQPDELRQVQRLFAQYAGLIGLRQGQVGRALGSLGPSSSTYRVGGHGHGSAISNPRQLRSSA